MNVLDAAQRILEEVGEPLHYKAITARLLEQGLWSTPGKTPHSTVNSRIAVDIKQRGTASRFRRVGPGVFALNDHEDSEISTPEEQASAIQLDPLESTLSFTDSAERILEQFGDRKPMHYRDITERALALGLLATQGKTPHSTMYAQILNEIQRRNRRGDRSRFVQHGNGLVGLSRWMGQGLAFQIEQHNQAVRSRLLLQVKKMHPEAFEALIGRLLTAMGFEQVAVSSYSGDGGIDVRGTLVVGDAVRTRMAVQVKRWSKNVQRQLVQQVRGSLGAHEQGLIITTSDFSKGARDEAERADATPVGLMNGQQLVNLLVEHDIGVHRSSHDIIELGEDDQS